MVLVNPPLVPVTIIVDVPIGVTAEPTEVLMVNVEVQVFSVDVGEQDAGEKLAVAPVGRPLADKATEAAVPAVLVTVMALVTELPLTTVLLPLSERE